MPTTVELESTNTDALEISGGIAREQDIKRLTEVVFSCANDPYYKLAAEGLRASACIVRRARPNTNDAADKEGSALASGSSIDRAILALCLSKTGPRS